MSGAGLEIPTVDVLMCAYNYGQYVERALTSALEQDYPPDHLRVIVIDDGSTDDTAAIVRGIAERHPGRVRLISQTNTGLRGAINRGLAEADAELVALLDADDIWLPEKTRRQAAELASDGSLGMVFCDMTVVDGHERVVRPSQVGMTDFPRDAYLQLMCVNLVTQSGIMLRRNLAKPMPEEVVYSDWWFALCAAEVSDVLYQPDKLALYREHGSNLTSGVSGGAAVRERLKEIRFHLWTLRHLNLKRLSPNQLAHVWQSVETKAESAMQADSSHFVELVRVTDAERAEADRSRAAATAAADLGDVRGEAELRTRALAWNPLAQGARLALHDAVERAGAAESEAHPLAGAGGFVVLTDAEELLADDTRLATWARILAGAPVTLAIDATSLPEESAGEELHALIARCGLESRDDVDMLAVVGAYSPAQLFRMRTDADAFYRLQPQTDGVKPVFTPETLVELRELLENPEVRRP